MKPPDEPPAHRALRIIAVAVISLALGLSFFLPVFETGMKPVRGYEAFLAGLRAWRQLAVAPDGPVLIVAMSWLANLLVPVGIWAALRSRLFGLCPLVPGAILAWLPLLLGPSALLLGFYLWSGALSALAILAALLLKPTLAPNPGMQRTRYARR